MPLTILVVEDQPVNLKLCIRILAAHGHSVIGVGDAEEGIRIARERHLDVILMDIGLPGMDGLTATRAIRGDPDLGHIPVVAFTGHSGPEYTRLAEEAGCCGHIVKPINARTLPGLVVELARAAAAPAPSADGPTGLHRMAHPGDVLDAVLARAQEQRFEVSVARIDVVGLGRLAARLGPLVAGRACQEVAEVVKAHTRETDFVASLGEGSLLLTLPYTGADEARAVVERVSAAVDDHAFDVLRLADGVSLRLAFGLASCRDGEATAGALVRAADEALPSARAASAA